MEKKKEIKFKIACLQYQLNSIYGCMNIQVNLQLQQEIQNRINNLKKQL